MLWRVRTNLPDRPGSLADLARTCAEAGVNIAGVQVFPGVDAVTDELVLDAPEDLDAAGVTVLVEGAGGTEVIAVACTADALTDQPARYVEAARAMLAHPSSFPDAVAHLLDADVRPTSDHQDVMELTVGDVQVQIRRDAPFTDVERARGAAMAGLVGDVLEREHRVPEPAGRLGTGSPVTYAVDDTVVRALAEGVVVGTARLLETDADEPGTAPIDLGVDVAWQRRGIGTRLLSDVARLARSHGATEVLLRTRADNQAVMPMVLSAGMRGRIRMAGDELTVRVPLRELRPLERT